MTTVALEPPVPRTPPIVLRLLALDLDGTLAEFGIIEPPVHAALEAARTAGFALVLVTGRILSDVRVLLGGSKVFQAVVAEEGGAIYFPAQGRTVALAPDPSEVLMTTLRDRGIWARAGMSIVELDAKDAGAALTVIRELQLPLVLHFNRSRVMVLPQSITKATGLREAARMLRMSLHDALAIGDAENDHELLHACEIGVAVGWGSPALQRVADHVLPGTGPQMVAEFLHKLAAGQRLEPTLRRRPLLLGRDRDGRVSTVPATGSNLLVAGDPRSGKSWIAGLLCEQLIAQQYSVCLIDPEGDYSELEALHGVLVLGGEDPPPSIRYLLRLLRHADLSIVVDLSRLELRQKRDYVLELLPQLAELRRTSGLPHRLVIDEAHHFLHDDEAVAALGDAGSGLVLVTYQVRRLVPALLAKVGCAVVTKVTDPEEVTALHRAFGGNGGVGDWLTSLSSLEIDEAARLPCGGDGSGTLRRLRIAPRLTRHVRHSRKYLDLLVPPSMGFQFVLADGRRGPCARSLQQLVDTLAALPPMQIAGHIARGDFSRWIDGVFQDATLAASVEALEERQRKGGGVDFGGAVIHAVHGRYGVVDDLLL